MWAAPFGKACFRRFERLAASGRMPGLLARRVSPLAPMDFDFQQPVRSANNILDDGRAFRLDRHELPQDIRSDVEHEILPAALEVGGLISIGLSAQDNNRRRGGRRTGRRTLSRAQKAIGWA